MMTKIFHPNIDDSGMINLDILKDQYWQASYDIFTIASRLQKLLIEPNFDTPLVQEIVSGGGREEETLCVALKLWWF